MISVGICVVLQNGALRRFRTKVRVLVRALAKVRPKVNAANV